MIQENAISELVATEWRGKSIHYSDNGGKVAGEFFWPADFLTLLHDMQNLLGPVV
jgi:hypothetical protein